MAKATCLMTWRSDKVWRRFHEAFKGLHNEKYWDGVGTVYGAWLGTTKLVDSVAQSLPDIRK